MANILLIKTFSFKSAKGEGIPLAFLYLSAELKKAGHRVKVIDLALKQINDEGFIKQTIEEFKPQTVGITCNTHERFGVLEVVKFIKRDYPGIITVVGGPHITLLGEDMMKSCDEIDIGVIEDGENTIVKIADNYDKPEEIKKIPGIYYRQGNEVKMNPADLPVNDLDIYGHPDLDVIDLREYSLVFPIKGRPKAISVCTSRGCPYNCNFCAATRINYGRIRFHSAHWIFDEVKRIIDLYGNDYAIFFYDDHFLLNKQRVLDFCKLVKENNLKFKWGCYSRIDRIDEKILSAIKEIGCIMLTFGIESGSDKILKLMNKNITSRQIVEAIKKVKSRGIAARGSFIFGYPGENLTDILKTFLMIYRCGFEIHELAFATYTIIYPQTKLVEYLPVNFNWHKRYSDKHLRQFANVPVYVPPFNLLRRRFTFLLFLMYKFLKK